MNRLFKKVALWLCLVSILVASSALLVSAADQSAAPEVSVEKTILRYQGLLLKVKGTQYIMTTKCRTGATTWVPCIAVRVSSAANVERAESVYPDPLVVDGILIRFTDQDPPYNRGGITIHN